MRRFRFWLVEKLVLPAAMPVLRLLVWTWRTRGPEPLAFQQMVQAPRVVFATYHGMFLQLLAFSRMPPAHGRRMVALLSPSLDGRLLAATLAYFDIDHVYGTTGSCGIAGAREFIRRVEAGDMGVIAVDGPRGPCCVAQRGFLQIAAAAQAPITLATTSARRGLRFGSWDRAHLPAPFARVTVLLHVLPPPVIGDERHDLSAIQSRLLAMARAIKSPVLPPRLRTVPSEIE